MTRCGIRSFTCGTHDWDYGPTLLGHFVTLRECKEAVERFIAETLSDRR
jgi:hypothetical protein